MKKLNVSLALIIAGIVGSTSIPCHAGKLETAVVTILNHTADQEAVTLFPSNYLVPLTFVLDANGGAQYYMGLQLPVRFDATFVDQTTGLTHQCMVRLHPSKTMPSIDVVNSNAGCTVVAHYKAE